MANLTQIDLDIMVDRIKTLVGRFGGQSQELTEVRKWYEILRRCPEAGAFVALEAEVKKLESKNDQKQSQTNKEARSSLSSCPVCRGGNCREDWTCPNR